LKNIVVLFMLFAFLAFSLVSIPVKTVQNQRVQVVPSQETPATVSQKPVQPEKVQPPPPPKSEPSAPAPQSQPEPAPKAPEPAPAQQPAPKAPEPPLTVGIDSGTSVSFGAVNYSLNGAALVPLNKDKDPATANIYLIIDMVISNSGSQNVAINPLIMFRLTNQDQEAVSPLVETDVEKQLSGKVGENRSLSGQLRFEIPKKAGKLNLEIDPIDGPPTSIKLSVK